MDLENEDIFSAEYLYGEYIEDVLQLLSINPNDIFGEKYAEFENLMCRQIERAWNLKISQLPTFGQGGEWLNTRRPLDFKDLDKKIYVIDFFTYCCINCIHILPYLKSVEKDYADNSGFAVIGIHSPKFPNERNLKRVKEAVQKNQIKHPVLNDPESRLWNTYGITCWPTIFIVGPAHTLLFTLRGEEQINKLSFLCHITLKYFKNIQVELDLSPIPVEPEERPNPVKDYLFPGSVTIIDDYDYVVVSDTGHNRLLIENKCLVLQESIGSGEKGCNDGSFDSASFNAPNGTAWFENVLYVADTGNHSIRKVDFNNKTVSTLFRSEDYKHDYQKESNIKIKFQSPWDLCVGPKLGGDLKMLNTLYIAVAGSHQIWSLDLDSDSKSCHPFAGTGREESKQNLYRMKAGFAQPSGVEYSKYSPNYMYVADSESSTIKRIDLKNNGAVDILVGGGLDPSDLFQFGDKDGERLDVKLQHPMSVCVFSEHILLIADTYNHKIKLINTKKRRCSTLHLNAKMAEPSGLCIRRNYTEKIENNSLLFVADTNNHRVVTVYLNESSLIEIGTQTVDLEVVCGPLVSIDDEPNAEINLSFTGRILVHCNWSSDAEHSIIDMNLKNKIEFSGDLSMNEHYLECDEASAVYQPSVRLVANTEQLENIIHEVPYPKTVIKIKCYLGSCDGNEGLCIYKAMPFKVLVHYSRSGHNFVNLFLKNNQRD